MAVMAWVVRGLVASLAMGAIALAAHCALDATGDDGTRTGATPTGTDAGADAPIDVLVFSPDAACVDILADPYNCGACGHVCSGAHPGCERGQCQPTKLAASNEPHGLAVGGNRILWTDFGTNGVYTCASDCPSQTGSLLWDAGMPEGIAARDDFTAWVDMASSGGIWTCRFHAGCLPTKFVIEPNATAVATDGKTLLWAANGDLNACPVDGCPETTSSFAVAHAVGAVETIAIAGSQVYLASASQGFVKTCTLPNCDPVGDLAAINHAGLSEPRGLAATTDGVYVADSRNRNIVFFRNPTGMTVLANEQRTPYAVAVDGDTLYWANQGDGSIRSCPIAECAGNAKVVWSPADGTTPAPTPYAIAVDSDWIYWTDIGLHAVVRVPK
jgi:hypothetical protein